MGQECSCQCGDDKGEMDYKEVSIKTKNMNIFI